MSYTEKDEFEVLHGLRIKGMTKPEEIAETTGLEVGLVTEVLDGAVEQERARKRSGGRVEGYMLTADGRERHQTLRASNLPADLTNVREAYEAFLGPNRDFKAVTTKWQTEADSDISVVLPELVALDENIGKVLDRAALTLPRMSSYQNRFTRALEAFRSGDSTALARPMSGSYHDVWMELHEDLIQTLGLQRTDADE
jgi:DNA-binding MarR family transcriptional regulator